MFAQVVGFVPLVNSIAVEVKNAAVAAVDVVDLGRAVENIVAVAGVNGSVTLGIRGRGTLQPTQQIILIVGQDVWAVSGTAFLKQLAQAVVAAAGGDSYGGLDLRLGQLANEVSSQTEQINK